MHLAKPCLDIGVFTNRKDEMLAFYRDEVGLPYEELLPVGGGVQQHRHGMNGSVFKLNHARDALPELPPSGYHRLTIARADLAAPRALTDPDGNALQLVPMGWNGVDGIAIDIEVQDLPAHATFWSQHMQATALGDARFRLGTTVIALHGGGPARGDLEMRGRGFRYLTVQVFDVRQSHNDLVAAGVWEGRAPNVLGDVARISFVRDPDGNWIEISQRKSLTGSVA